MLLVQNANRGTGRSATALYTLISLPTSGKASAFYAAQFAFIVIGEQVAAVMIA
jgi:hypothetical protein